MSLSTDSDTGLDLLLTLLTLPENSLLRWTANAQDGPHPVRSGWSEVCKLVSSLDGAGCPWLVVDDLETGWSFQVLGSAEEMILEVAMDGPFRTVGRTGTTGQLRLMPFECRWWVEAF